VSGVSTKDAPGAPPRLPFSSAPRLAPAHRQALAALALLGAACGPLLGIDEVGEAVGSGGAAGLAAGQGGAPEQGSAGVGGAVTGGTGGASGVSGTGGTGGGPPGFLRFANLRPPTLPDPTGAKLDVCVRREGTEEWQGPILKKLGAPGLAFEQASGYGPLPPGAYEAVAVSAALGSCTTAEIKLESRRLALLEGRYVTLAVAGRADAPQLIPYAEGEPPANGKAIIAVSHATPDVAVSVLRNGDFAPIKMALGDSSRVEAAPGNWPIAAFLVDDIPYAVTPDPSLPRNFYSAFLIPPRPLETAPIALLLCENSPPRPPGGEPGNASCLRLALDSPPIPPVP
jgi:hypothetical protein